jgi:hypothetical protein
MDRFVQMNAGTLSPAEFFAPESVAAIMTATTRPRVGTPPQPHELPRNALAIDEERRSR